MQWTILINISVTIVVDFTSCNEDTEFTCDNHRCVNSSIRCDGKDDCGDNSDEQKCGKSSDIVVCRPKVRQVLSTCCKSSVIHRVVEKGKRYPPSAQECHSVS